MLAMREPMTDDEKTLTTDEQLARDAMLFGASFKMTLADGTYQRRDPRSVFIKAPDEDSPQEKPA
jgi:hypothetical protein